MNRPKERIEFYDPETNAVLLAITDPTWLDILVQESDLLKVWGPNSEIAHGIYSRGLMEHPNLIRIPVSGLKNLNQFKILKLLFNKVPLELIDRNSPIYKLGTMEVTAEDLVRALSYFMIPNEIIDEYLDIIIGNAIRRYNNTPSIENTIEDKIQRRKNFLLNHEPHIGSEKSNTNLRYERHVANLNRREANARRRWINENNDEYIERNWGAERNEPPNLERNYEYALNLPLETLRMSEVEFEKWLRTHPNSVRARKEKNKTMNRNWRLGNFFKNAEGGRRTRRNRRSRRRNTRR
jgi:hypothetical protein